MQHAVESPAEERVCAEDIRSGHAGEDADLAACARYGDGGCLRGLVGDVFLIADPNDVEAIGDEEVLLRSVDQVRVAGFGVRVAEHGCKLVRGGDQRGDVDGAFAGEARRVRRCGRTGRARRS